MTSLYFAYGSNLSDEDRADYAPPCPTGGLRKVGVACLPDRRLGFTRLSETRQGGVLDVVPQLGCVVEGVIYEVADAAAWAWLDRKEGAPKHYRRFGTVALTPDGAAVRVQTYEVVKREEFVEPARDYLAICRAAYAAHMMSAAPLDAAASNLPASPNTGIFVYGTLMRGEPRHGVFADHAECVLLADGFGDLFDCGAYPALRPGRDAAVVRGEFIRVGETAVSSLLQALDEIEGFTGYGPGSLFARRLMDVGVGEGRVRRAWVYVMPEVPALATKLAGDWRARHGRRSAFLAKLVALHCGADDEATIARKIIESRVAWGARDVDAEARALLPLAGALERGDISERLLARASGRWTAAAARV